MSATPAQFSVELTNRHIVAIDGGTATGKGRLIEELSQLMRLKGLPVLHISTGSLYRAVGYAGLQYTRSLVKSKSRKEPAEVTAEALKRLRSVPVDRLLDLATKRRIEMHGGQVWMDGQLASMEEQLKAAGVGMAASIVSVPVPVRRFVNDITRRQINEFDGYVVIDGRDVTNGVTPDAPLKLLLTVAPHIAAQRSKEHTVEEIIERDRADRDKPVGALRHPDDPGEGVIVLPTDEHTPESVRDHVYALMQKTFPELPEI
ncbi:MAG: Cytidylate kinase [Candidatus Saccharibacteria bacterium]|jgi:cytidylate kinase|nr:Cytidylate kinase [Candidatus Saccharibacteria bacterium]